MFPRDGALPPLDGVDHVVVLGAIWAVYDDSPDRAWIASELAWLRQADDAGVGVLGICFGAQALAVALGGQVRRAARQEIGWTMVESADPEVVPAGPWMEFHGDRCFPPESARVLARNELGVQAYSLRRHLAVQFHPEVDGAQLKAWFDSGARSEVERDGQDPDRLLAQTVAEEPAARQRADRLVASALRIGGRG
jgi:GMP synthase-like glutamine amidotransferase